MKITCRNVCFDLFLTSHLYFLRSDALSRDGLTLVVMDPDILVKLRKPQVASKEKMEEGALTIMESVLTSRFEKLLDLDKRGIPYSM